MLAEQQAIEELLNHNGRIIEIRQELKSARTYRFIFITVWGATAALLPVVILANIFTWGRYDMTRINIACVPTVIVLAIISGILLYRNSESELPSWESTYINDRRLRLEIAVERKRLYAARTNLTPSTSRHIYREGVSQIIEQYRIGQRYYRRVHNLLQSLIIVGSLASSTVAGLAEIEGFQKWVLVGTTFAVGIASGFTGYFKFRERGFYLQQTADAIDEEKSSLELRIGRYGGERDPENAIGEFATRVEALRSEQRKREQQLDQPTENTQH
ncbi:SLATT domain-containing protein [Nonomuraea sp. NBC_00507]|uniref:SLATT domain-containing protein n=1 Tax=Nonomuraea sp. NBC_00507 TaxID=2976002 RepID=UPI002E173589